MGVRQGHPVVVNRQLCANAFEQVLEERRHVSIASCVAIMTAMVVFTLAYQEEMGYGLIYYLMKPLEWLFLLVLYLVDRKPENPRHTIHQTDPEDFD